MVKRCCIEQAPTIVSQPDLSPGRSLLRNLERSLRIGPDNLWLLNFLCDEERACEFARSQSLLQQSGVFYDA
jgi:hypothetical protein